MDNTRVNFTQWIKALCLHLREDVVVRNGFCCHPHPLLHLCLLCGHGFTVPHDTIQIAYTERRTQSHTHTHAITFTQQVTDMYIFTQSPPLSHHPESMWSLGLCLCDRENLPRPASPHECPGHKPQDQKTSGNSARAHRSCGVCNHSAQLVDTLW